MRLLAALQRMAKKNPEDAEEVKLQLPRSTPKNQPEKMQSGVS